MECDDLIKWTLESHYDMKYSTEDFLYLVFKECKIDSNLYLEIIEKSNKIKSIRDSKINICTNFKRTSESIMVLGFCSSMKIIKINPLDIIDKNLIEEYDFITSIIENHYAVNNGKLKIWKDITEYVYVSKLNNFKLFLKKGKKCQKN